MCIKSSSYVVDAPLTLPWPWPLALTQQMPPLGFGCWQATRFVSMVSQESLGGVFYTIPVYSADFGSEQRICSSLKGVIQGCIGQVPARCLLHVHVQVSTATPLTVTHAAYFTCTPFPACTPILRPAAVYGGVQ